MPAPPASATTPPPMAALQPREPAASAVSSRVRAYMRSGHIPDRSIGRRGGLRRERGRRERRHGLTEHGLVAAPPGDPLVHLDDLARLGVPGKVLDGALI